MSLDHVFNHFEDVHVQEAKTTISYVAAVDIFLDQLKRSISIAYDSSQSGC